VLDLARKGMEKDKYMYMYLVTALICIVIAVIITAILIGGNLFGEEESGKVVSEDSIPQADLSIDISEAISTETSGGIIDLNNYIEISVQNNTLSDGDLIFIANTTDAAGPNEDSLELKSIYSKMLPGIYTLSTTQLFLKTEAIDALNLMLQGFYDATTVNATMINNAYTSIDDLRDNDMFQTFPDLASGRSVRLVAYPSGKGKFGVGVYLWITEHCNNYGYILRYPSDKAEQIGVDASVSLYRYVGIPHAKYMKDNNLALEEYLELLKEYDYENPLIFTDFENGEVYRIYYKAMGTGASTTLNVPSDLEYTVSGNNIDGFIVTVAAGNDS